MGKCRPWVTLFNNEINSESRRIRSCGGGRSNRELEDHLRRCFFDHESTTNDNVEYTHVPLSKPYRGANSTSVMIYRVTNCTTGKYQMTYTPTVRGYYQVSLMTNAVEAVQTVQLMSDGHLGGNLTLTEGRWYLNTFLPTRWPVSPSVLLRNLTDLNALTNLNTVSISR